ncbi:uncharacterized protein LOC116172210 isoform X2 [Photinus pyralis]|uniref:uncharacterized protein LOC116172210 isoform X2 n=1 Tax=Photinus pyralis TaxID=7054 RepID=UPI0012671A47|nr:uncharacterized protein LOC116172210 isoform X2 [Photinus pyralis]
MRYLCRLCSSTDKIIDVYHSQLESGKQLRRYIWLASGIEILWNDPISRMVCHRCCEIAVKLHKYRSNAVANDKLLKEKYGQPYTAPITDKDELLSAASRIFNLSDIGTMKDDADPLELLNTYISNKSARNGKGTKVNVENVSKVKESVTIKPSTLSPPNQTHVNALDNFKDKTTSAIENDKAVVPLNNAIKYIPKPHSVVKCDIPKAIRSRSITPNADTEVHKSNTINSHDDKGTPRLSQSEIHTYAHPSVKQLFKEYQSIKLPKEVFSSDVSPRISIDPTEVSDWYTQQLQNLKDKLKTISSSNSNPLSSSDDEDVSRPRLRKRKHQRIIDCSDSEGDDEWLPFKIQAQDVKSTKPTRLVISNSNATARSPETSPQIPNCSNVTSDSNYTVVNRSNPPKQPGSAALKLKIMKHLPPRKPTNTESKEFLASEPNSRVLQSLLTSNDQTLANLYTDFSKYGINIENSEPPIHYENEGESTSSLTDMVLEAIVGQKPEAIKPVEATVTVNKVNDDIICISDDENDAVDQKKANSASFINSNEEKMIHSLLKKHLNHRLAKESQTFHPNDSIIHRTKTNLIALPNMVGELRRYKMPIDLKHSVGNVAHFENNLNHNPRPTLDKWSIEECTNISLVKIPSCTTQTANLLNNGVATNARNSKPLGSSLWNQMFVDRITNAIKNKCNDISSNLGKSNQVTPNLVKSNQQVTANTGQPNHITSNLITNAIRDKNVTSVISPCVDNDVNRQKPIILNGSNSLSLHSLLYSEKTNVDRSPDPAARSNSTISPLLQNYLQANTVPSNCLTPPRENSENLTATIIQPPKDVPQGDMTSKIRVKNMSELL